MVLLTPTKTGLQPKPEDEVTAQKIMDALMSGPKTTSHLRMLCGPKAATYVVWWLKERGLVELDSDRKWARNTRIVKGGSDAPKNGENNE